MSLSDLILAALIMAVVIIAVICGLAVLPRRKKLADLTATINNVRDTVANLDQKITQCATTIDQAVAEVRDGVTQLQQAVTNVQGSVTQATFPLQQILTTLQTALTQDVAAIQQSLGQLARSENTKSEFQRVRENIGLMRSTVETVLALTWSRLMPGMPPFAPQIQSIDPRDAPLVGGLVKIEGRNFSSDCRVWFGTRQAQPEPNSTITEIVARAPASQPGEVDVCVQSPNGLMSAPHSFTYH
jgi:IPT/TIG domain